MDDIGAWLAAHKLKHYAAAFAENDIGMDVLADLDDADLKELGLSLGDRKRFMKAAAELVAQPKRGDPAGDRRLDEGDEDVVRALDRGDAVDPGVSDRGHEVPDVGRAGGQDDVDLHDVGP